MAGMTLAKRLRVNAMPASHAFAEHTGEVRLEVRAPSCEALFAEAGRALAELMLGEPRSAPAQGVRQAVEVHARDRAALLVEWLNELIFLSEANKLVFTGVEVERVDETGLRGAVWGVAPEVLQVPVKAATWHQVKVEQAGGEWRASVVLDV